MGGRRYREMARGGVFNSRLNPCSIWGRPFEILVIRQDEKNLTVECTGRDEVALVRRRVSIAGGSRTIGVDVTAENIYGSAWLVLQPNGCHSFPGESAPLLQIQKIGKGFKNTTSILDHDCSMIFPPVGNYMIYSSVSGCMMRFECDSRQIWGVLSQASARWFTWEPYGRIQFHKKGEKVRLKLKYELDL